MLQLILNLSLKLLNIFDKIGFFKSAAEKKEVKKRIETAVQHAENEALDSKKLREEYEKAVDNLRKNRGDSKSV